MSTQNEVHEMDDTHIDAVSGGVQIDLQKLLTGGDDEPNALEDIILK